ncbi:Na+/H+ antiporter NhaA [Streptomyces sp. NPDC017936]|uniref:Na+/H+ antiporter NhaA n=1 Tax=Streptomyces sp. NPDC017936 TaxID=3365016 RepID=UPI003799D331
MGTASYGTPSTGARGSGARVSGPGVRQAPRCRRTGETRCSDVALPLGRGGTCPAARYTRAQLNPDLARADAFGLAALAGIGFTVALLIGELTSPAGELSEYVKAAVPDRLPDLSPPGRAAAAPTRPDLPAPTASPASTSAVVSSRPEQSIPTGRPADDRRRLLAGPRRHRRRSDRKDGHQ